LSAAAALQLTGDAVTDQQAIHASFIAQMRAEDETFYAKFQERRKERKRPRVSMRDRGVQITQILSKLGEEVYRPDDLSYATYIRMTRDSEVSAAVDIVKNSTLSRGWVINGGKPEHREWFKDMYRALPMNSIFEQVLTAFEFGFSVTEKVYGQRPGRIESGSEIFIEKYKPLPPWTIALWMLPNGRVLKIRQYTGIASFGNPSNFDLTRNKEGALVDRRSNGLRAFAPRPFTPSSQPAQLVDAVEDFNPDKINIFTHNPKFGNPFGLSALKPVYTDWILKEHLERFQAEYMQVMAGGHFIGYAGYGEVDDMRDELVQLQSAGVAALPDDQRLEIIRPQQSKSPFMDGIRYHGEMIQKGLLVPVLLMGQKTEFGSRSLGETHFELFKITRIQKMQQDLQRWIQNDINLLAMWNWGETDTPKFRFKAWSTVDLEQLINTFKKAAEMGLIVLRDAPWIRDIMEFPEIEEIVEIFNSNAFFPGANMMGGEPGDQPVDGPKGGGPGADRPDEDTRERPDNRLRRRNDNRRPSTPKRAPRRSSAGANFATLDDWGGLFASR